jgi:ABC-2 type transport system ATP-binding protein
MPKLVLEAKNLYKNYTDHQAVSDFSLELPNGHVCALLGQNGAGKSSVLRMLAGVFLPDNGSVSFGPGLKVGYLPEERGLYPNMKVVEHLEFLSQLKGLSQKVAKQKANEALDKIGLFDWKKRDVKQLSKGMQQKVQLLATIIHEPQLLILDEPFSGLDPVSLLQTCELIKDLKNKGTAIIISTHQMKIAEEIADSFCFLNRGKTVWQGQLSQLKTIFGQNVYQVKVLMASGCHLTWTDNLKSQIIQQREIMLIPQPDNLHLGSYELAFSANADLKEILHYLVQEYNLLKFEHYLPSLDEAFKRLLAN